MQYKLAPEIKKQIKTLVG